MPHRPIRLWVDQFADCDFAGVKTLTVGQTVDNWFMVAKPGSLIMTKMYERLKHYWRTPKFLLNGGLRSRSMIAENWRFFVSEHAAHDMRVAPYFLWQYIFTLLIEKDREFSSVFEQQPFSSPSGGCGHLAWNLRDKLNVPDPLTQALKDHIIFSQNPLSKLVRHNPLATKLIPEFKLCLDERRRIEGF